MGIIAPPKYVLKDRDPNSSDISSLNLKIGDKWINTIKNKIYFIILKPWSNNSIFCVSFDLDTDI